MKPEAIIEEEIEYYICPQVDKCDHKPCTHRFRHTIKIGCFDYPCQYSAHGISCECVKVIKDWDV